MATETSDRGIRSTVQWADPYPKLNENELQGYATCVIDGKGWRVSPSGRSYCIGRVEILPDGTTKPVADRTPDSTETHPAVVEDPVAKIDKGKTIKGMVAKANNGNFATRAGRPKKSVPEDFIRELSGKGKTVREIALILGDKRGVRVHYSTIHRILAGQRVLV